MARLVLLSDSAGLGFAKLSLDPRASSSSGRTWIQAKCDHGRQPVKRRNPSSRFSSRYVRRSFTPRSDCLCETKATGVRWARPVSKTGRLAARFDLNGHLAVAPAQYPNRDAHIRLGPLRVPISEDRSWSKQIRPGASNRKDRTTGDLSNSDERSEAPHPK